MSIRTGCFASIARDSSDSPLNFLTKVLRITLEVPFSRSKMRALFPYITKRFPAFTGYINVKYLPEDYNDGTKRENQDFDRNISISLIYF